jgi:spore maturation protein CgeB
MKQFARIAMFGSSLVSAYWNGAATYYRGILRALNERGFDITFYEPDAYNRQAHRDIPDPEWANVVIYPATPSGMQRALDMARRADILIKASGVGVFDRELEAAVASLTAPNRTTIFWDVDAPATLDRVMRDDKDPFHSHIPEYDLVLTYGGGDAVVRAYTNLGARRCVPIYNALDASTHFPVQTDPRFGGTLGFLGNRLPDREARVVEFFLKTARLLPEQSFVLGGSGWNEGIELPENVRYVGHVYTRDHNAFNCSPLAVININRDSMASYGFSPPTRVFEAAGAGACLLCDHWEGIERFLEPGREILPVKSGEEVAEALASLDLRRAKIIGIAARQRILSEHTYSHRASLLGAILDGSDILPVRHGVTASLARGMVAR